MDYKQTRQRLVEIDPDLDKKLPQEHERRVDLREANLREAKLSWSSHDLLSEILRLHANSLDELKFAGLVLIQRQWCWDEFLALDDPLVKWR